VQVDHATIPTAVFSQPEVGTVGLTETEARARVSHVDVYKTTFRPIKATMSGRDTRVLMKLVVDGLTDRVLGCHIVGDSAAEIIQAVAIAVKMKATKADFDATIALPPAASVRHARAPSPPHDEGLARRTGRRAFRASPFRGNSHRARHRRSTRRH
jgi:glutathione reductase (NADPH)